MKKGLLILSLVTLSLINFASAGFIGDTFDWVGIENLFLVIIFLGSFTLSFIPLSRVFKQSGNIPVILAILVALGITAGVHYTGFDISGIFFDLGINETILFPIVSIILLIGIIYFIWKKGFGVFLMSLGALLFTLSWISYEEDIIRYASAILFIIGAFLWWRKNHPKQDTSPGFWTKNRKMVGEEKIKKGARWGAKKSWGGAKATGKWAKNKALSETFAKDRNMSKRRAEKAAYEEKAKREEWDKKVKIKQQKDKKNMAARMQKEYNLYKRHYTTAKTAGNKIAIKNNEVAMKNIVNQANRAGIKLRY